ncbi:hypothetical protein CW304_21960 [Bacillus sp. UFRGS-B20]|nr:hypothetical protein CW304_21960 [Bacillus sp. UFRGS-B20]
MLCLLHGIHQNSIDQCVCTRKVAIRTSPLHPANVVLLYVLVSESSILIVFIKFFHVSHLSLHFSLEMRVLNIGSIFCIKAIVPDVA